VQAVKEEDQEMLKLLDNSALFIHGLIKQRLILVSDHEQKFLKKGGCSLTPLGAAK
jgi:hypothetical protein